MTTFAPSPVLGAPALEASPRSIVGNAGAPAPEARPRAWQVRLRSVSHKATWFLGRRFSQAVPLVFVTGYPKTGTTWACQLVADYLMLPFPRFALLPIGFEAVVHGHELVRPDDPRGVYVMRDGRDALVSQYFFLCRFIPSGDNPAVPRMLRPLFKGMKNKDDVVRNLPAFLEGVLTRRVTARPWHEHVMSFYDARNDRVVVLRYEDLVGAGAPALASAMEQLTGMPADLERAEQSLRRYSFGKLRAAPAGRQGDKFLRKGRSGDWANHFTRESAEVFDHHAGRALVRAGYERDSSWVASVPHTLPTARAE